MVQLVQKIYTKLVPISSIMRLIKIPEGGVKVLVQGIARAQVKDILADENILSVHVQEMAPYQPTEDVAHHVKLIKEQAEKISLSSHAFSPDFHIILSKCMILTK